MSDVHGRADALARAADGADALICLGDLLLFLDYADHGQGIFADLFGVEAAGEYVRLRTEKKFDEAREFSMGLFASRPESRASLFEAAMTRQYAELFGALPERPTENTVISSIWRSAPCGKLAISLTSQCVWDISNQRLLRV